LIGTRVVGLGFVAPKPLKRVRLAKFCQGAFVRYLSTMSISLLEPLKSFLDEHVSPHGFGISSEYVRELIRKDF
jgi:hypothetical protein